MRHALLLALLLSFSSRPALAGSEPTSVDIRGWTVTQYNDTLVARQKEAVQGIYNAQAKMLALGPSQEVGVAFLAEMRQKVEAALVASQALPPWKGDAALRDALVETYQWTLERCDRDFAEMLDLAYRDEVHNADLARLEALNRGVREGSEALDLRTQAAQKGFAQRQRMIIVPSEQPVPAAEAPSFSAPGIPPEGSTLDGSVHVGFAVRYQNPLVAEGNRMIEAMNAFFDATGGPAEQVEPARQAALAAITRAREEAAAREDWQGDSSLRNAVVGLGDALTGLLNGEFATYAATFGKKKVKPAEVEALNEAVRAGNAGTQSAIAALNAAEIAFQERWGLTAYAAWEAALPKP